MSSAFVSRVAVVTGAAQGIGKAIALRLARDGCNVVVNDLPSKEEQLQSVVVEIENLGRKGLSVVGDASEEEFVANLVNATVAHLGSLDIFVANAGIVSQGYIVDSSCGFLLNENKFPATLEQYDTLMNLNARGTFLCFREAAKQMIKQGRGGRILGACSANGKKATPGAFLYSCSKFFIRGLVQAAAQELGPYKITVNAYAPGVIQTPMLDAVDEHHKSKGDTDGLWLRKLIDTIPVGRIGTAEDVAALVSYLASDEAGFVTGQAYNVNGGTLVD